MVSKRFGIALLVTIAAFAGAERTANAEGGESAAVRALRELPEDELLLTLHRLRIGSLRRETPDIVDALQTRLPRMTSAAVRRQAVETVVDLGVKLAREMDSPVTVVPAIYQSTETRIPRMFGRIEAQSMIDAIATLVLDEIEAGRHDDGNRLPLSPSIALKDRALGLLESPRWQNRRAAASLLLHMREPRFVGAEIESLERRFENETDAPTLQSLAELFAKRAKISPRQATLARRHLRNSQLGIETRRASVAIVTKDAKSLEESVEDLLVACLDDGMSEIVLPALLGRPATDARVATLIEEIFDESPDELPYLSLALRAAPHWALEPEIAQRIDGALRDEALPPHIKENLRVASLDRPRMPLDLLPPMVALLEQEPAAVAERATRLLCASVSDEAPSPEVIDLVLAAIPKADFSKLPRFARVLAATRNSAGPRLATPFLDAVVQMESGRMGAVELVVRWGRVAAAVGTLGEASLDHLEPLVRERVWWNSDSANTLSDVFMSVLAYSFAPDSPRLRSLAADRHSGIRELVAKAYRAMGPRAKPALPSLVRWLRSEENGSIASAIVLTLGTLGRDAKDALLGELKKGGPTLDAAIEALGAPDFEDPEVVRLLRSRIEMTEALLSGLSEHAPEASESLAGRIPLGLRSLWNLGPRGQVAVMEIATAPLLGAAPSAAHVRAAADHLATATRPSVEFPLERLEPLLTSDSPELRSHAARIANAWGDRAIPVLARAIDRYALTESDDALLEAAGLFGKKALPAVPGLLRIAGAPGTSPHLRDKAARIVAGMRPGSDEAVAAAAGSDRAELRAAGFAVLATLAENEPRVGAVLASRLRTEPERFVRQVLLRGILEAREEGWRLLAEEASTRPIGDDFFLEVVETIDAWHSIDPDLATPVLEKVFERGSPEAQRFVADKLLHRVRVSRSLFDDAYLHPDPTVRRTIRRTSVLKPSPEQLIAALDLPGDDPVQALHELLTLHPEEGERHLEELFENAASTGRQATAEKVRSILERHPFPAPRLRERFRIVAPDPNAIP